MIALTTSLLFYMALFTLRTWCLLMIHFNVFNTCSYTDWDHDREALQCEYPGIYAQSVVDSDRVTNAVNIVRCEKTYRKIQSWKILKNTVFPRGWWYKQKVPQAHISLEECRWFQYLKSSTRICSVVIRWKLLPLNVYDFISIPFLLW